MGTNQVNFDYYSNRNAQTSNNTSGIIGIGSGQQEQDAYAQWWAQYYAENPELYNRQDGFFTGSDQTTKEKLQDIRQQGSTAIKNFDRVTKQMFSHFVDNYTPVSITKFIVIYEKKYLFSSIFHFFYVKCNIANVFLREIKFKD